MTLALPSTRSGREKLEFDELEELRDLEIDLRKEMGDKYRSTMC